MWKSDKLYTIGKFGEMPEGLNSISRLRLLTLTLAWAAENDIPFQEAILTMTDTGNLQSKFRDIFIRSWDCVLKDTHYDLVHGFSLGKALRRRMRKYVPLYYIQAVEQAEIDGNLPEALRSLTRNIDYVDKTHMVLRKGFRSPLITLGYILLFISGLMFFIIPKLRKILDEMLAGSAPPRSMEWLILASKFVAPFIPFVILALTLIYVIRRIPPVRHFVFRIIIEPIAVHTPVFGRPIRDLRIIELCVAISSYLARGEDIISAAKYSMKAMDAGWLRRKLKRFINTTESGTDWLTAWSRMKLDAPMNELILRNAASQENIVKGFDNLTDWLFHFNASSFKKLALMTTMLIFAFNASLVFWIELSVFQSLMKIINNVPIW